MEMPGREALFAHLESALVAAGRAGPDALVVVRLRKLAAIADLAGRDVVRQLLAGVASRLARLAAERDFIADLGEGTFAMLTRAGEAEAETLAQRMVTAASAPVSCGERQWYAPANAGICALDPVSGGAPAQLERAMRGLEQAMAKGPGAIELVSEARVGHSVEEWHMRSLLEEAGLRGELTLAYQPVHAPDGSGVCQVEALMRWNSPVLGRVGPDRFIPVLEESGLVLPVGESILRQACAQARQWRFETGKPVRVAVNVSPIQVVNADFERSVRRVLAETGCEPQWIELEITEGALVRDFARMRTRLEALAAMGITLAIDDFGAGHSSLGQLAQLPVHHLKMDRSLICGLQEGGKRAGIAGAVVALADALGLSVTSEGVELPEQAAWLARFPGMHCQGYLFSRPMPAEQAGAFLGEYPLGVTRSDPS